MALAKSEHINSDFEKPMHFFYIDNNITLAMSLSIKKCSYYIKMYKATKY